MAVAVFAFLTASGVRRAGDSRAGAVANHLEILTPAQDEAILPRPASSEPTLFYHRLHLPRLGGLRLRRRGIVNPAGNLCKTGSARACRA